MQRRTGFNYEQENRTAAITAHGHHITKKKEEILLKQNKCKKNIS